MFILGRFLACLIREGDKYANTWKVIKYLMYGRLGRAF
jgi:hypothetical protein